MFTKRNSSGQQWMRYEQGIFSAIKNSKKVFSLDEHTGEFSSRNKVKNSIVVRPTAPNTTQKASTKAKVNKSPRKTNLKMMTLVKGVKMMEKSGQKEHTPIPFKLDSSQQYYNKHLYNISSPANADQNKLMVSMSMQSKIDLANQLKKKKVSEPLYDSNRGSQKRMKLHTHSASGLPLAKTRTENPDRKEALKLIEQDFIR